MNMKSLLYAGVVGLVIVSGCQSGMYSSSVSVDKRVDGISDYTVVSALEDKDLPASMPVVVESRSSTKEGDHGGNNLLWAITLGLVPGISSEATINEVTIKTPLGEKSGTCTVEASHWMGWLPIFLPYPGVAEERTSYPKLPNETLETRTRNKLVANLVSQFSKSDYARCVEKRNSPELKAKRAKEAAERERLAKEHVEAERIRIAKEAAERARKTRLANRTALFEKTVEHELAAIRKSYSERKRYLNPFLADRGSEGNAREDWLAKWASPRLDVTEEDALAGNALLSAFGTKYLPNAYANYEKKRDALMELQQVFNEEFSQPWLITSSSPKWNAFNKVLEKFVKVRTEFFICHDELCHYWLLSRFGILSGKDFAALDARSLAAPLLPEDVEGTGYSCKKLIPMENKISEFANKYAPECHAIYQKMSREYKEHDALLSEVVKQRRQMDDARHSRTVGAAADKMKDLIREMNALSLQLQAWYMEHRTTVKSSDEVAKCDAEMCKRLKPFVDALPNYMKEHVLGPVIAKSEMIAIPERDYRMQRTEVTQLQWMVVMGNNPSKFRGPDRPVEQISYKECQEFIKRARQMDGRAYWLPTEKEWEYACLAGSTGAWGKRANGECGPLEVMGWYKENSGRHTHAVALKEPNAWGLFDMHGNVWELCQGGCQAGGAFFGVGCSCGTNCGSDSKCEAFARCGADLDCKSCSVGFRLADSQD